MLQLNLSGPTNFMTAMPGDSRAVLQPRSLPQAGAPTFQPPPLPAPPLTPSVPGVFVDVSPNPGTQITAVVPADQLMPSPLAGIPKWALVVGGLSIAAIIIALFARR